MIDLGFVWNIGYIGTSTEIKLFKYFLLLILKNRISSVIF